MSYCPECGSEVAQNDVFCAYCGFALPKVAEQQEVEDAPIEYPSTSELAKESPSVGFEQDGLTPLTPTIDSDNLETTSTSESPSVLSEILNDESSKAGSSISESTFSDELVQVVKSEDKETEVSEIEPEPIETPLILLEEKVGETEKEPEVFKVAAAGENTVENNIPNQLIEETPIIETETPMASFSPQIEVSEEEISEPIKIVEDKVETAYSEQGEILDRTIPDNYQAQPEINLDEIVAPTSTSEIDEEEKLKSVLDEINLSLQSQNEITEEKSSEPIQEEGVVIPTAANLQQEFIPPQLEDEVISPSASNYGSALQTQMEGEFENPINRQEFEPIPENFETPVVEDIKVVEEEPNLLDEPPTLLAQEISLPLAKPVEESATPPIVEVDSEDKEGRAFTNPNIGVSDTDGRNKTKLKPLEEGTILNSRYEIVRKIGGGGMGAVYLATDKNLGGVLRAVKEMVQSYIEDEQQEKAVNDFKRESLLLTSLEHNAIPTIYDYFFDEKEARFYLVMKYISGGDLAARLRSAPEGRIDEVSVTEWAIQITDVLDYLHNRQPPIVYRDLKPSNIMIDGNTGKLMIIDFGIARWVNKEEKGVTAVGTMGYAPPELFSGNVEPRSDIYSLGSTMFHLLTGADPQSNPLLIFDFNKNPKPRQINSQLSDQMEQILMRAVEYNSAQRFNSALEMRQELIKHMENLKKGTVTFGVINTSPGSPINANVPVFCGFCGQKIVATDMFCPFCGAQQPLAAQSKKLVQAPVYAAPTLFPRLMIIGTSDLETTDYLLEKDSNLLGRRDPMSNIFPEVDLSKFDPQTKISRKHARIWREGDVYMLEDLGSSNGTTLISIINGSIRLLPRQPHVLSHGDKVRLGDTTLRFTIG